MADTVELNSTYLFAFLGMMCLAIVVALLILGVLILLGWTTCQHNADTFNPNGHSEQTNPHFDNEFKSSF